jgi:excisionase family DNA binding protein
MTINRKDYLTTGQAAARMGVSRQSVLVWIKEGKLPALRTPGGRHLVHQDDAVIERYRPDTEK